MHVQLPGDMADICKPHAVLPVLNWQLLYKTDIHVHVCTIALVAGLPLFTVYVHVLIVCGRPTQNMYMYVLYNDEPQLA